MAKILLKASILLLAFTACKTEKYQSQKPVYVSVPDIALVADEDPSREEGSLHEKINTVWLRLNGNVVGAYELPATMPLVLEEGDNQLEFFAGISLNGINSQRVIYDYYQSISRSITFTPDPTAPDTLVFENLQTQYTEISEVQIIEDFDGTGLRLTETAQSDTGIYFVSDSSLVFKDPEHPNQNNGRAGVIYTDSKNEEAFIASANNLDLPTNGRDVYVELTYRCNQPFYVGIIADLPGQTVERPVVRLNPQENWNKIYINLVTELLAVNGAQRFKLLFSSFNDDSGTGEIYLDNIKIVY